MASDIKYSLLSNNKEKEQASEVKVSSLSSPVFKLRAADVWVADDVHSVSFTGGKEELEKYERTSHE